MTTAYNRRCRDFTPETNGYIIAGSTLDYNAGSLQTIASFNYHNLTLSNGGTKTFAGGTTGIASTLSITGSAIANAMTNSATIEYNGMIDQTAAALPYYNMIVASSGGTVFAPPVLDIAGNLVITSGTFAAATTINVKGNWTNGGTFTAGSGTVIFKGTLSPSVITGTTAFNKLTIDNNNGLTLGGNTTVIHTLTFASGK